MTGSKASLTAKRWKDGRKRMGLQPIASKMAVSSEKHHNPGFEATLRGTMRIHSQPCRGTSTLIDEVRAFLCRAPTPFFTGQSPQ
jgi:hypothetical protein